MGKRPSQCAESSFPAPFPSNSAVPPELKGDTKVYLFIEAAGKEEKDTNTSVSRSPTPEEVRPVIWAEDRCGQLWCDHSLPGCRPIVDHGFYEVIHWERHEHRVSNQNGARESHTGALLLCAVISCSFHLSLPVTPCQ